MKSLVLVFVLLLSGVLKAEAEVKLDSLIWVDYQTSGITNTNQTFGNQFFIERAYLNLRGDIGKDPWGSKIKGRFTLDFAFPATPVKFAYFDYDVMAWNVLVVSAGLLQTKFGNGSFWETPIPAKDATEQYATTPYSYSVNGGSASNAQATNIYYGMSFSPSADFGVGVSGKFLPIEGLTKNLIYYDFELLNGEGYKIIYGITNYASGLFAVQGSVFISPLDGIRVGGSYRDYQYLNAKSGQLVDQSGYAIVATADNVVGVPVYFNFEYLNQYVRVYNSSDQATSNKVDNGQWVNNNFGQSVVSVTLGYGFLDKLIVPYIRYDIVNANNGATNTSSSVTVSGVGNVTTTAFYQYSLLYLGFDFIPDPNLVVKPFYWINLADNSWAVKVQLEWKMAFTVW